MTTALSFTDTRARASDPETSRDDCMVWAVA